MYTKKRVRNYLNMKPKNKIKTFTDLDAWKESHKIVLSIYKITKSYPEEELFGLTTQIRRSAVSITSNIAEGFSRQSYKQKLQFYSMALGSLTELQNQLLISRDVSYVSQKKFDIINKETIKVHKIINGLIKSSKSIIHNS